MVRKHMLLLCLLPFMVLFCASGKATTAPPLGSLFPTGIYMVQTIFCPEADMCLVNLVGESSILGDRVVLRVGDYQVPSVSGGKCRLENLKGFRAAAFLEELLKSAEVVLLMNAHKNGIDPTLRGDLLIDGKDVTVLMFEMHIAVPKGIKVDWCESIGRRIKV
jgi:hypothetical protein